MARDTRSEGPVLDPRLVANQAFSTVFRGFDTSEVRGYLEALGGLLSEAAAREAELFRRLADAEERLANPPPLDEHELTVLLGTETARVLESARRAAAEIRSKAEEHAGRLLLDANAEATATRGVADEYAAGVRSETDDYAQRVRAEADDVLVVQQGAAEQHAARVRAEADDEVARLVGEAESVLAERTTEAEETAATIRAEVEAFRADTLADVEAQRERTTAELDELRQRATTEVADAVEAGRQEGRSMVAEARAVRERMLSNLAERRRVGRAQLDQLRVTRQELLSALDAVKRQIDAAATDIAAALPAARAATEETAQRDADDEELLASLSASSTEPAEGGEAAGDGDGQEVVAGARATDGSGSALIDLTEEAIDAQPAVAGVGGGEPAEGPSARTARPAPGPDPSEGGETGSAVPAGGERKVSGDPANIDVLFAQIRDSRAQTVAEARDLLHGPPVDVSTEKAPIDVAVGEGPGAVVTLARAEEGKSPGGHDEASSASPPVAVVDDAAATPVPQVEDAVAGRSYEQSTGLPARKPGARRRAGDEASASLLDRRDGATDAIERRLSRRLKRILSDEQNEMLDLVRRSRGAPSAEALLPDAERHAERYASAAADDLAGAAAVGAKFFGNGVPTVTTSVDDIAEQLATELVGQLRNRLERCFDDSQGHEAELDERIRASYREWKTQRIADASRHFVLGAFTRGLFDAAPEGTAFRWVVDDGGTPCPDAEDNALGGDVAKGDPFPTGDTCPPAHPGCRCLIVPASGPSAEPVAAASP